MFARLSQPHNYRTCTRCAKHREVASHFTKQRGPAGSIATSSKLRRSPPKPLKSAKVYATVNDLNDDDDDDDDDSGFKTTTNSNTFFVPSSPYKPHAVQPRGSDDDFAERVRIERKPPPPAVSIAPQPENKSLPASVPQSTAVSTTAATGQQAANSTHQHVNHRQHNHAACSIIVCVCVCVVATKDFGTAVRTRFRA